MEASKETNHVCLREAKAGGQHDDEGGDTASDADHREIDIEDVEEADLGVLASGDEEPDIKPIAENNNPQQTDSHH